MENMGNLVNDKYIDDEKDYLEKEEMENKTTAEKIKTKCKYCSGEISLLKTSNHIIGCNLEAIADVLRYRGEDEIANELDKLASRIK